MRRVHQGRVDSEGNYRNKSRKDDGYLARVNDDFPFPALVTAWYPKSQTIDVLRPVGNGSINYDGVVVYGDFFDVTGTIRNPKIATKKPDDIVGNPPTNWTTIRDPNSSQSDPNSEDYVLDNHIEALVFKTSVGYAASNFRFLNIESTMLNNSKPGRKITRHDDGSYYIHDEDGNIQFKHPSGLNLRAGKTTDDMDLEVPFTPHEKNAIDYGGEIVVKLEHPSGSYAEYASDGKINLSSADDINLNAVGDINLTAPNVNVIASTKHEITAPNVNAIASTKFKVTSPESEMTGNLTVGGIIKAVGDIIADMSATVLSLLSHFHQGNLGYPTGTPIMTGGGTAPSNPPTLVGDDFISGGDVQTGTNNSLDNHDHDVEDVEPGGAIITTTPPN